MTQSLNGVTNHENDEEAVRSILDAVKRARESGKFFVAVFSVTEDNRVFCETRTTWNWPHAAYKHALAELAQIIRQETTVQSPLPVAQLFGKRKPDWHGDNPSPFKAPLEAAHRVFDEAEVGTVEEEIPCEK